MQMNGSGIICDGYLLYNPSEGNIGTVSGYSDYGGTFVDRSTSSAPSIGSRLCYTAYNNGNYPFTLRVTFTGGTYVPVGGIGTVTGMVDKVSTSPGKSEYRKLPYVRYA